MELSKIGLFLQILGLWSKNNFYNIFSIFTKEYKIDFRNSKCKNFPPSWPLIQNFLLPLSNYLFFCSSEAVKVYTYIWEKPGNLAPPPSYQKVQILDVGLFDFWCWPLPFLTFLDAPLRIQWFLDPTLFKLQYFRN